MGLDASVMCRCLADGKVALPKFAKKVKIDEEGYLNLDLPSDEDGALHMRFYKWMSTACPHPGMILVNEHIDNWAGYRSFQQALGIAGWQHFPTLKSQLPQSNGGLTPASAAKIMLDELDYFEHDAQLGSTWELVDCARGNPLYEYIEVYDGIFGYGSDGINLGVDPGGFFIRQRTDDQERETFRSKRFEQTLLGNSATTEPAVEYTDLETHNSIRCDHPITSWGPWPDGRMQNYSGQPNLTYPPEFRVVERPRKAADYEYVVGQLRKICRASLETGNPVRWC